MSPNGAERNSVGFAARFAWYVLSGSVKGLFRSYEFIYGHSGWAVYAWVTCIAAAIARKRAIHAVYCPFPVVPHQRLLRRVLFMPAVSRLPLNHIERVVAISRNVAESLASNGVRRDRIVVVPPAVDIERFRPGVDGAEFRSSLGLRSTDKIGLNVGNLQPSKGLDVLLMALPAVVDAEPDFRLIVTLELGHAQFDQRKAEAERFLTQRGLREHVIFLGFIENMPACISAADVFVSPYRDTQGPSDYPIALIEALAIGKPVVGTAVGGIPELIRHGENGFLVPAEQPAALADALIRLLKDPALRERFGHSSRAIAEERFDPELTYAAHCELFGSSLGDGGHPRREAGTGRTTGGGRGACNQTADYADLRWG